MSSTTSWITEHMSLSGFFSSDIVSILLVFVLLFAYTMYFGRGKMISFILALYPATIFYKTFPFIDRLIFLSGEKLVVLNKLAIFLLFLIPLNIIINRYIFSASDYSSSNNIFRSVGLSLSALILLMVFYYGTINLGLLHDFGGQIDRLFDSDTKLFYWNLASIILLAFL